MASTEPAVGWRSSDVLAPAPPLRRVRPPAPVLRVERLMRPQPPAVEPGDGLATAAARMREARLGVLPVLECGRLVGMITERDVLLAVADRISTDVVCVGSYMRPAACVIGSDACASEAAARMVERRVGHLLVVCAGEVVGVLSASRLLREWGVPWELLEDELDERDDRFV